MASYWRLFVLIVSSLLVYVSAETRQFGTENVINVTAVSENEDLTYNVQVSLNITLVDNKTTVNGVPLKPSEVMRMPCKALLLDDSNVSLSDGAGMALSSVLRLMLDHSYLQSETGDEVLLLLTLGQEMIQLGEEKVWQPDVWEVKMLLNQTSEEVTQEQNIYPARSSKIVAMPRENDIVVAEEYVAKTGEDQVLHTTSHYPLRQAETTQEETAAPGKLPETPLRMEPSVLYEGVKGDEVDPDELLPDVPLRQSPSSYNEACRWLEDLRDKLRRFCSESLPLFFLIMWVVVVGVVGSAVIIKVLELLFPTCEHKGFFHLNPETLMPVEEKQSLIENMQLEVEEQDKSHVNGELY
ncbi:glycoprotein integral membrane protein 1 [Neoarius graeffei]|uniref:glycoprotein integral membrane protein 1 n=1 Tax=Neoarius graeffei TaxID=443677 RepID=UPI00298C6A40|nr:glycoprotein integral membrane protein 1 [Neoarius graeffei]